MTIKFLCLFLNLESLKLTKPIHPLFFKQLNFKFYRLITMPICLRFFFTSVNVRTTGEHAQEIILQNDSFCQTAHNNVNYRRRNSKTFRSKVRTIASANGARRRKQYIGVLIWYFVHNISRIIWVKKLGGPIFDRSPATAQLVNTVFVALKQINNKSSRSIAVPLHSSGIFVHLYRQLEAHWLVSNSVQHV